MDKIFNQGDKIEGTIFEQIDLIKTLIDRNLGITRHLSNLLKNLLELPPLTFAIVTIISEPEDVELTQGFDDNEPKIYGLLKAAFRFRVEIHIEPGNELIGFFRNFSHNLVLLKMGWNHRFKIYEFIYNGRVSTEIAFVYNKDEGDVELINLVRGGFFDNKEEWEEL